MPTAIDKSFAPQTYRVLGAELRAMRLSLFVGALLVGVKFLTYYLTKSAAIFSDAMENVVNVCTSAFALYAIRVAHRPADAEHPYGHGKIEFMSAGFEGGMILLAAVLIIVRAGEALALRQAPMALMLGVAATAFSTILCAATGAILKHRGSAEGSIAVEADGIHLLSDAVTGFAVMVALIAVRLTGWNWLDPLAAIGVSFWIIIQGLTLMRRAAAGLMDEQDAGDADMLARILNAHIGPEAKEPRICSFHKLRHRHSGRQHWVEFHIQVPGSWNVEEGHRVATAIEMEIERELKQTSATAHLEPCVEPECTGCKLSETKSQG